MRGILLVYWLSFLGTSLSMSRYNDCNYIEQVIQQSYDIQICVCYNQVYVNCTLNGANVGTKKLTKKEELCYKSRVKLGDTTEQKTCVCSGLNQCHGEEERALLINACARKAVIKITPIRSQLETLCCEVQKALLKLWFRLEERVFLRLIKSISHDSLDTRTISRRLRRTKWCNAFHSECLEADMSIRKGCKIRHKRDLKETHRSYNTESIPFTKGMTKGLHEHTKQSGIQSTMVDMTTTSTQTTRFLRAFTTKTWPLRSTATTGDDEEKVLSMSGHWPKPTTSPSQPPSSSSSSSLSSVLLLSSSSSSSTSSSISSTSSSSPPPRRKSSQGLLPSTLSSSPSHLSQNLSPVQSFVKPSTATAELQTTFTSSIEMSTLLSSVEISSLPTKASSSKVISAATLTSAVTSNAQIDYSSSRSYSSISSSSASLHVKGPLLSSYASPSTSSSSSLSPTPRHWALGVTTKMRPETSTSPGMASSGSAAEETTAAILTKEPSLSSANEVTPVKETSPHSSSKTITLTMAQYDEFTKISDSSQVRTSTPMITSRVASLVASSFDRRISDTRRKPSVTLLGSSSIARRSTTLPEVDTHSKYDSRISIPDRESLDLTSKIDITMMVTSPPVVPRSPVILGSPSTRTRQTYEYSSSNVPRTSSIKVIKRTPKTTINATSSTTAGLRMAITLSSWTTMAEPTSGLYQSPSSLISLSSPSTPFTALAKSLLSSASTILLSTSSSSLLPSLSVTASESSSPFTKQEMPVLRLNESKSPLTSVLEFATSSIQPSKSQIILLTSHLSATSTPSVPIYLPPKETIRTLVPSTRRTSHLSSSSSSSSSFHKIFIPESELLSAVSSPSLVSPASTTLQVDTSSMHSIVHTSSSLHKSLISTSVEPTLPLRTSLHNYSIFTKELAMGKISKSLSSVTLMSVSSTISEQSTPSLKEYQTMSMKAPVLLPSPPSSSLPKPLSSAPLSTSLPSSLSSSPTPSTQPLSTSLLPSSLSSPPTPSSKQPLSTSLPSPSSSATPSSKQPLSTSLPSPSSSATPSTQPLSPSLPSLLSSPPTPSSTQPLSSTTHPSLSLLTLKSLSSSTSSANGTFEWQSMLQVTKTTSKRVTLSTQNYITESVQNSSAARRPLIPPHSASSSPSSTSSPTSHFPSSSVKLFLTRPSVYVSISSSTESPVLLTSVSSLLKSSPTSLLLPSATSTAHVSVLSSSQSFTSLTLVSSSSLTSKLLSSLPSTSFVLSRQLMTPSLPLPLLPTSLSLFLSSTSPMPTSSVSSSSSLLSTPPLSSSLMPSLSLSSAPILLSSPLLATPLLSYSLSSTSISSSLIPSSLQLSLSPTKASTLWPSLPSSLDMFMQTSTYTHGLSTAPSLMPTSLQSLSPTPSSPSLTPSVQFSSRSSMVTSSNVQLPKSDNLAKTILPSKTLLVNRPSSPPPSEEPYIKAIFLAILDGNCLEITSRESFKSAFIDTLTNLIGLQSDAIGILDIRCGSVEVLFSIKHKQTSNIAEVLDKLVKEQRMNIAFNGKTYRAIIIMSLHPTTARPTALTPSVTNPTNVLAAQINERRLVKILFILFVSIFGALALFVIVVCIAKTCGRRRYSRLRLKTSTLSSRGTNQIYKNELELIRMSPLHRYADYYGGTNQEPHPKEDSDEEDNINNRTALLNMLRNGEIASRRGKITVKDDDSYSSIAFY